MGKTALIEHAYRDKSLWKFDGLEGVTVKRQLAHFHEQLGLWTGEPLARGDPPRDWSQALRMLAEALEGHRGRETVVLVAMMLAHESCKASPGFFQMRHRTFPWRTPLVGALAAELVPADQCHPELVRRVHEAPWYCLPLAS